MVGGAIIPGKPVANMYFTLYGYQTYTLTLNLLRDLKMVCFSQLHHFFCLTFSLRQGQYTKLPPRATFAFQTMGGIIVRLPHS